MSDLALKNIWNGPGYRDLRLDMIDPDTRREYALRLSPQDVQRLIYACADAVKQIGTHPPLDWKYYPTQIHWPEVRPWMVGPAITPRKD
jgi:hypothetical protein